MDFRIAEVGAVECRLGRIGGLAVPPPPPIRVARMRTILDIGYTDLRLFLKRKSAYVWLFVVPLAFIYFMGFAARGPGDPHNRRPVVLIDNADTNFLGRIFVDELGAQGLRRVTREDHDDSIAGEIQIPESFSSNVLRQVQAKVQFAKRGNAAEGDSAILQLRLVRAVI